MVLLKEIKIKLRRNSFQSMLQSKTGKIQFVLAKTHLFDETW